MKEAMLYDRLDSSEVRCRLCRHGCRIKDGKTGLCMVKKNSGGKLYSLVYDKVVSTHIDPIEKKPLFHFAPGSRSYSIATVGCNFQCSYCQNYSISQMPRDRGVIRGESIPPAQIAWAAKQNDCASISYTYTEPTIYYELARDTMVEAKKLGILNVFVTNGYMSRDCLNDVKDLLDAANVDLKAFNDRFYRQFCRARRKGVMDTLQEMKAHNIWVEITTLLIPGENDDSEELRALARFIRTELGPETPWHVSRFHPDYKVMGVPRTGLEALKTVRRLGLDEGLYYVYSGNVMWDPGEETICPGCSNTLLQRTGYLIRKNAIKDGRCSQCGRAVDGVEM
jgi:pyruvate formate lyase activating enzyme